MINTILDEIIEGLQERSGDIFYDFHEFGDVDANDNPVDAADANAEPGRYQSSIEKFCVAAEGAEKILQALKARPDLAWQLFTEENESKEAAGHPPLPQDEFEITPGPWTVKSHPDTEGAYIVKEARYEQQTWGPDGYDISDQEGDRRDLIVERRDAGNVRLIAIAPKLFEAFRKMLLFPDIGREQALEALKSIVPNCQTLVQSAGKRGEA
jgi:hypothetical protein